MRTFFYLMAMLCGMVALALVRYPVLANLDNFRDGLSALFTLGMVTAVVPFAVALAVIPLCIAFAVDRVLNQ